MMVLNMVNKRFWVWFSFGYYSFCAYHKKTSKKCRLNKIKCIKLTPIRELLLLFSHTVLCDSLWPHGLQHSRTPFPWPSPRACSKLMSIESVMPSNHLILCHPRLLLPSIFPASGSFLMSQLFTSGGQSIRASASALPMNIQDWFSLGLTGLISLQSKRLSGIFSNTTVQKYQ